MKEGKRAWIRGSIIAFVPISIAYLLIAGCIFFYSNDGEEHSYPEYPEHYVVPVFFTYSVLNESNWDLEFTLHGPYDLDDPNMIYSMIYDDGSKQQTIESNVFEHSFPASGRYNVTMMITNTSSSEVKNFSHPIMLGKKENVPPFAVIEMDMATSYYKDEQPVAISAYGSYDPDGEVIFHYWEFGDGTHSDLTIGRGGYYPHKVAYHIYESSGDYVVRLWVMDNEYAISSEPVEITVRIISSC